MVVRLGGIIAGVRGIMVVELCKTGSSRTFRRMGRMDNLRCRMRLMGCMRWGMVVVLVLVLARYLSIRISLGRVRVRRVLV